MSGALTGTPPTSSMPAGALAHGWDVSPRDAARIQAELRARVVAQPPAGFDPRRVAGADMSIARGATRGYAGLAVLDVATHATLEEASAAVDVGFPYVPGLLSFRELPALAAAWPLLARAPDVVIFDGHGYAHPRRFGLACHGGVLFGVPAVGCAKTVLVGSYGKLADRKGATAKLAHRGEVVGVALRTRPGVAPVYVSVGHLVDLDTAVGLVLRMVSRYREPETTRRAHRLVNRVRVESATP